MLQNGGDPLQPHASIHRRLGQLVHDTGLIAIELHEDVVPDLDVAIAILIWRSRGAAGDVLTVIVKNLSAGAARSGIAHHPEVVRSVARPLVVADAHNALSRHADRLVPDLVRLIILGINRDPQALGRQLVDLGQQLPGIFDRIDLEVVAKGKIAEHLEERVMPRGITDVLQVVVLAAGTYALLRRGGAHIGTLVETEENVLELVHPGVGKQQRRVVVWHQRARGDDLMAF